MPVGRHPAAFPRRDVRAPAGVDLRHVAYRGAAATVADLVAGHIPMVVSGTTDLAGMHSAGRVRVLVTSNATRSRFIPDVPTFRELGYDLVATGWYGATDVDKREQITYKNNTRNISSETADDP